MYGQPIGYYIASQGELTGDAICDRHVTEEEERDGEPITHDMEADTPTHCLVCEDLIPHALTSDGFEYVGEYMANAFAGDGRPTIIRQWVIEYGADVPDAYFRDAVRNVVEDWPLSDALTPTVLPDGYIASMLDGYITAALWTSTYQPDGEDTDDVPMDDDFGPDDLTPDARTSMSEDVAGFARDNAADLAGIDPGQAGHDFWLTRNGHGAGFWGRGLGAVGDRLTDASRPYGESALFVEDGQVYVV